MKRKIDRQAWIMFWLGADIIGMIVEVFLTVRDPWNLIGAAGMALLAIYWLVQLRRLPPEPPPVFLDTLWSHWHWSKHTFGPGRRTKGLLEHIGAEMEEIKADPLDTEEWVDVMILALDGALRSGASPETVLATYAAKVEKNKARVWPDWKAVENADGHALMHIEDPE